MRVGAGDGHELEVIGWAVCFSYAFHPEVAEYLLEHGARHTIFSAVATPGGDLVSPTVLGFTMYILFELTIIAIRRSGK